MPMDVMETALGFLQYTDVCKVMQVSRAFQLAASNIAQNFRVFHKEATLRYQEMRRGARVYWIAKGILRITRVTARMVLCEHVDETGVVTSHYKIMRCMNKRNVLEFKLGDCGVRYGGTGLTFASDDSRWEFERVTELARASPLYA